MLSKYNLRSFCTIILGSAILSFGLYQVHSLSGVTEGGVLGLNLLLEHWFHISPSITNFVINLLCYAMGWKLLGKEFLLHSAVAAGSFSLFYGFFEQFDHLWPQLYEMPLVASILGALFVGVGVGLCVRENAAVSGDDALAMCIHHLTGAPLQRIYLISDVVVLLLSISYIPLTRLAYSLLTVIISGQIIGRFQPQAQASTVPEPAGDGILPNL